MRAVAGHKQLKSSHAANRSRTDRLRTLCIWLLARLSITAADANVEVAIGDYEAILICLIAEVASAYADYRTSQQRLEYACSNLDIQERSLEITQSTADEGATGYVGLHLAKSSLETTRAGIPTLKIALRQSRNRLRTLLGVPIHDLSPLNGDGGIPTSPPEVAVGIPVDLIRRRPDVRAAKRAIAVHSEQLGIATADLYPYFSINGEFAYDAERFNDLFSSASTAGTIGPFFSWDLLNYGRLINNVRLQEAGLQELIADCQNSVLTANQEVEDALIAFLQNQERVCFLAASVTETEKALRLLTIAFQEDEISFTGVFVLQGELVAAQDQLAAAQGDVMTSLISVCKALGGGWEIRTLGFHPSSVIPRQHRIPANLPVRPAGPTLPDPEAGRQRDGKCFSFASAMDQQPFAVMARTPDDSRPSRCLKNSARHEWPRTTFLNALHFSVCVALLIRWLRHA